MTTVPVPNRTRLHAAILAVAVALTAALVAGIGSSSAAPASTRSAAYAVPTGGQTMLKLDAGTAQVLADNDITVAPASEAKVGSSGITFPITGGLLNAKSLAGSIKHSGGLTFTAGGKSLTIRNFVVSTTSQRLSAYADEAGATLPVLRLDLAKATIRASKNKLAVYALPATLTPEAAKALNEYFGTDLFAGGLKIGSVRVDATIRSLRS